MNTPYDDVAQFEGIQIKLVSGRLLGPHVQNSSRYFWRVEINNMSVAIGFATTASESLLHLLTEAVKHDAGYEPALKQLKEAMRLVP